MMRKVVAVALCAVTFSSSVVSAKELPIDKQDREYMETMNDYCKYVPFVVLTKMIDADGEEATKRFAMDFMRSYMTFEKRHPDLNHRLYKSCAQRSAQAFDLLKLFPDSN